MTVALPGEPLPPWTRHATGMSLRTSEGRPSPLLPLPAEQAPGVAVILRLPG